MKTTLRFLLVGTIGAIVELSLFSSLVKIECEVMLSNFLSFHCAFITCFFLHYYYTYMKPYGKKHKMGIGFIKYAILMYSQLVIGSILLWLLINIIGWLPEFAKIAQLIIIVPISYFIQKIIIFPLKQV
jgi:putative flippase GtrA